MQEHEYIFPSPFEAQESTCRAPTTNTRLNGNFEKEINAWAEANVDASKQEECRSKELQRESTKEEAKECVVKLKNSALIC